MQYEASLGSLEKEHCKAPKSLGIDTNPYYGVRGTQIPQKGHVGPRTAEMGAQTRAEKVRRHYYVASFVRAPAYKVDSNGGVKISLGFLALIFDAWAQRPGSPPKGGRQTGAI
jgi:hypothetical protein